MQRIMKKSKIKKAKTGRLIKREFSPSSHSEFSGDRVIGSMTADDKPSTGSFELAAGNVVLNEAMTGVLEPGSEASRTTS